VHNNHYFLRQICTQLNERLAGFTLVSCFSQSKDELVIEFNDSNSSFFIRASLLPEFSCVTFPSKFQRARKNSIDLFNELLMKLVTGAHVFQNERSFAISFDTMSLIFMMHGNRSNILLANENTVVDIFRRGLENDINIIPGNLNKEIDWSRSAFEENIGRLEKLYFTFGKPVWAYLNTRGFDRSNPDQKWHLIQETLEILNDPKTYFICEHGAGIILTLVPVGAVKNEYSDPILAANDFAAKRANRTNVEKRINDIVARSRQQIRASQNYLQTSRARLAEIENDEHYKMWGDLIMANLHRIGNGTKSVTLENFYEDNKPVDIPLDAALSPQKNAERYYRKSKNQVIEIGKLREAIAKQEERLRQAEMAMKVVELPKDDARLQPIFEQQETESRAAERETVPFWQFEYKGFVIWAGKDAANNDELTTKWAHKNDLWLHVRDVPGSHVIVRHRSGKPFPRDVIEYAAGIAAWNSKRRTESLCPVIVTQKKFVRKRKGDPAGSVVVDREEVILVEPRKV
jgi:predicted ribosome quality control (RQC) complex YloA/Tae2 family protein